MEEDVGEVSRAPKISEEYVIVKKDFETLEEDQYAKQRLIESLMKN